MGSGVMSNAALVSGVRPGAVAVSVYPVPGLSMRRSEKVAAPLTARALVVPVSAAPLGWVPSATVIRLSAPATGVPLESTTATRNWLSCCPARAFPGLVAKARPAGGSCERGVSPPPLNNLSKWQLAMSALRARTERVFIAAHGLCKGRTGSPPWNGQRSRLGDLNRLDTPAESKQQVCCPLGRLDRRTTGAGSREQGAGPAHPCSLLPAPCSLYSRLLYTSAVCSAVLCQVNVRAR